MAKKKTPNRKKNVTAAPTAAPARPFSGKGILAAAALVLMLTLVLAVLESVKEALLR